MGKCVKKKSKFVVSWNQRRSLKKLIFLFFRFLLRRKPSQCFLSDGLIRVHLDREIDKHLKPNVWVQRWEKSRNRELGVLLIDWFDDMDDTYGWSFGELVCVCCGASIGCVEYVVWDVVLTIFFLFHSRFCFMAIRSFFCLTFGFFCKIQKVAFFLR